MEDGVEEQQEKQEIRSIVLGVFEAVLEYRKNLSSVITGSSQNTNKPFTQLIEQGRILNTAIQHWLDTDSKQRLPKDLATALSVYGNPSGWPTHARVLLKYRIKQILAEYHFVHTMEQIENIELLTKKTG